MKAHSRITWRRNSSRISTANEQARCEQAGPEFCRVTRRTSRCWGTAIAAPGTSIGCKRYSVRYSARLCRSALAALFDRAAEQQHRAKGLENREQAVVLKANGAPVHSYAARQERCCVGFGCGRQDEFQRNGR